MKRLFSLAIAVLVFLVSGCASRSDYDRNIVDVTNKNARYLRSIGYHIVQINHKSGFIQAYRPNTGKSPNDLKMFYPNQQINPYRAVNTASGNQSISSITAYWLPGKTQMEKREEEIAQTPIIQQSASTPFPSVHDSPVMAVPDSPAQKTDTLTKAQHITL
jgi:hypothetical protein